jgi:hypothetical protein
VGQLVEVLTIAVEEVSADGPLLGANVDAPLPGRRVAAAAVEIGGWALGRTAMPDEIEVALDGMVVARSPVRGSRPDIAAAFPAAAAAAKAGFEVALDASRAQPEAVAEVRARFGSAAVPVATLRLRRCWRGEPSPGESPLVSVVVPSEGAHGLEQTVRSIGEQRYGPTELLIVHSAGLPDTEVAPWRAKGVRCVAASGRGAALHNEGIRRSNGQLILFVGPGSTLAVGALSHGVEALERRPEAAGLLDAIPDGEVSAAIYRRAAFEELGGFRDAGEGSCDSELARRASARYDLVFEPGALVTAGER